MYVHWFSINHLTRQLQDQQKYFQVHEKLNFLLNR